ncbi:hypothetical protein GWI33_004826 [Rhynchophorus ferrugineus]|uniref:Uncharacterized protein n=1 Tax=Rhynchophorus ferrugineus TaxID=354439 RepID=A0A834MIF6_RHYFE|nr:hypothetical protein GWI33_004826 [Rhynchophorus ferrugineus]
MEDDHEELLQCTDDESLSDTEDQCCPIEKIDDHYLPPLTFFLHTKLCFVTYLGLLVLSTLSLVAKLVFKRYKNTKLLNNPIRYAKLLQLSSIYTICGYIYFYSLDRNKVLCHLQDPVKGIVLVFALLYYFFFCRNFMGLHRIFSTTTVIVGLFVAIDYGLCDEFVCRGYDRKQIIDDAGPWSWKVHSIWTGLYIFGLTMFAAFFTLLDRHVLPENEIMSHTLISNSFVNTISRSVTASTSNLIPTQGSETNDQPVSQLPKCKSALIYSLWIHLSMFSLVLLTFWIDFIPGIGKGNTASVNWNYMKNGIIYHFVNDENNYGNVIWHMILFQIAYTTFTISSMKFLMLCQSAVFTIATMSFALPLLGVWWSLFYATPAGDLIWSPNIRGEFGHRTTSQHRLEVNAGRINLILG